MSLIQKGFQDPTYLGRSTWQGNIVAGANGQSSKFVAHSALQLMSLNCVMTTLSTSTYTVGGTATVSGQQLSLISVVNTASSGATAALSTTTTGPFLAGGGFASGGTGTAQLNSTLQYALNTTTSTANQGGVAVPAGAMLYVVSGTDATGASSFTIDYQIAPGAGVTM